MTGIIDYGVGNLFSLRSSFARIGEEAAVTGNAAEIAEFDRIVLPGVGAFADASRKLEETGLGSCVRAAAEKGVPLLGICLGMQLLFDRSFEYGEHRGLGLIPGEIVPIASVTDGSLKIPHMGWNPLLFRGPKHPLFKYVNEGDCVYFVHSYFASGAGECVIAEAEYGAYLTAAAARDNVMGCQFHPEKSGDVGLDILRAFCGMKEGRIC